MIRTAFRTMIRAALQRFDRRYGYDSGYLLDLYDTSPGAFRRFARLGAAASYRKHAPVDAYFAAKITAALAEDCGPCAQLCIDMAKEVGVAPDQIRAVVEADGNAMSPPTSLGFRYARAVLGSGTSDQDPHAEVRDQWGEVALSELALCVTTARMFPQMKRGLGRAQACTKLHIDGAPGNAATATAVA